MRCLLLLSLLAPAATAAPQGALPGPLPEAFLTDSTDDVVYRFRDLNADGDYDDAGEQTVYYDDTLGPVGLEVNTGIHVTTDGTVLVSDSGADIVLALRDLDADGECNDANEALVFFDGTGGNAAGIVMTSAADVYQDSQGVIWVASANTSSGDDQILRLEDLDLDGDANDVGEAVVYYTILPGAATNDSSPTSVVEGPDGALYYLENGTGVGSGKGVYRLEDLDASGAIDQPNEVTEYFVPPPQSNAGFHWHVDCDAQGRFVLNDTTNELVWIFEDADTSGTIEVLTEASIYWMATGSTLQWEVVWGGDGALYCAESQDDDRITRLFDADSSGTVDPVTETAELYNEAVAPGEIGNPRGLALGAPGIPQMLPYCFGTPAACPCGNAGDGFSGCENSFATGGARLGWEGRAQVSDDTLRLIGTQLPAATPNPGLYFQGTSRIAGGAGTAFGDGLRCAGGTVNRLGIVTATGGASSYGFGNVGQTPIAVQGALPPSGGLRTYQLWYRNVQAFCTSGEFNLSNALEVSWLP